MKSFRYYWEQIKRLRKKLYFCNDVSDIVDFIIDYEEILIKGDFDTITFYTDFSRFVNFDVSEKIISLFNQYGYEGKNLRNILFKIASRVDDGRDVEREKLEEEKRILKIKEMKEKVVEMAKELTKNQYIINLANDLVEENGKKKIKFRV